MLTKKQNLIETITGGNPDRYVNQFEAFAPLRGTAYSLHNPRPKRGEENIVNAWGVTCSWKENTPGVFPVHTQDKIVVKDIEHWKDYVKAPNVVYDAKEWEPFIEQREAVDTNEQFSMLTITPGVFEQCHYLCEIQNTLMYFYTNPDELKELIEYITEWEMAYAAEICKYLKPEALLHHDDWGSQISSFVSPDMFKEFIKPAFMQIYGYYKSHGVKLILHHSDSYAENLVPDMIDMGIDIWQGVITTNDIPKLIKDYGGKISFMGAIDNGKYDREDWTEESVGKVVREALDLGGKHYFIPCGTGGGPGSTYPGSYDCASMWIDRYSKEDFK